MRTGGYRKSRRQDIRFKRSLLRFTVAFLTVATLGLITRYQLHSYPLREKILQTTTEVSDFDFQLSDVQFRFRSGVFPVLGVFANRVQVLDKKCPIRKMVVQDLLVHIDPWALLTGRLQAKRLDADFVDVSLTENCSNSKEIVSRNRSETKTSSTTWTSTPPPSELKSKIIKKDLAPFFTKVDQLMQRPALHQVNVEKIQFNYHQSLEDQITFEGSLDGRLGKDLQLDLEISRIDYENHQLDQFKSKVKIRANNESVSVNVRSKIREGKFQATAELRRDEDWSTQINLDLKKIPLSSVAYVFDSRSEISYLWASCQVQLKSSWQKLFETPLNVDNCIVDGPYGEIVFKKWDGTLEKLNEAKVEVNKVNLDRVFDNRRNLHFSGVFSNYGVFSAQANYSNNKLKVDGLLFNSEIIFSNNNLRDIQKVNKIPFAFNSEGKKWLFSVNRVEFESGQFEGELLISQTEDGLSHGRVAIHRLQLNPKIYQLMLNSKPTDFRIYGKFEANSKGVKSWSAMVATPQLDSKFYRLNNLKVKGQNDDSGSAQLRITVGDGAVVSKASIVSLIQPTHLEKPWGFEQIKFKELSARLEIAKDRKLQWKRGYVRLENDWQLSTEGQRDENRTVTAWLQWDRPDRKFMRWTYRGRFFDGDWYPETPWVKEWLGRHPEFLKSHDSISLEGT